MVDELRKRAETRIEYPLPERVAALSIPEIQTLVHNLRVHQVELEMQNEELRHTQAVLTAAKEKYARLYHAAPTGYCTLDAQGMILECNATLSRLLRTGRDKLLRTPFGRHLEEADLAVFHHMLRHPREESSHEFRLPGESDKPVYLLLQLRRIERMMLDEHQAVWLGAASDVTRIHELNLELRIKGKAIESTMEGMLITDAQGRICFVNQAFERITGYRREVALGQNPKILKSGRHDPDFYQRLWEQLQTTGQWRGEIWNRRASGEFYPEWLSINAIYDVQNRPLYYVAVFADITERKRAEENLIAAHRRAEAANQAKSAFLANMSHELRTPLNAILGYAQILRRDPNLGPEHRQGAAAIQRSGDYLLTLINDILDLAKIEAGRFELAPGPCDLRALLSSFEDLFGIRAREKGIGFRCRLVEPLPVLVEADERRLRQIVINLLGNAVKFTERGEVCLQAAFAEGQLELEIADTGIGIAAGRLETLFQPFEQAGERDYRRQGTGLGLAITKSLVDQMGGRITIESTPGQGTRFRVNLPLASCIRTPKPSKPDEIRGYRRGDGQTESLRILVVDDVTDNRKVLRLLLESLGFLVFEAEEGQEALAGASRHHPDLILMDLAMPVLDGLEATRRLKADESLRRIPVIACSARAFGEDLARAKAAGCGDHLSKPVHLDALCAVLERQLDLAWIRAKPPAAVEKPPEPSSAGRLPRMQRAALLALVKRGDIVRLRELLERLGDTQDKEILRLRELAGRFDLKTLRWLLENSPD